MITLLSGTNRPDSNTRKVVAQLEDIYAELKIPVHVIDLTKLPPEIFSPESYAQKPASFEPFSEAILRASGLHVVTPEYNGGMPGVLKYFIDLLKFPESFEHRPVCFTGVAAGIWGPCARSSSSRLFFGYRNAYLFPERVFMPQINNLLGRGRTSEQPRSWLTACAKQAGGFPVLWTVFKATHAGK